MTADSAPLQLQSQLRLHSPGRKRILTLDGGGVRGIVSIAFMKEMETQLRKATGHNALVLSDVFDMVAGTSVGSMLATMVALGKPVEEIEAKFLDLAPKIFSGRQTMFGQRRFNSDPLEQGVTEIVKDERLESPLLKTGLAIIAKRVDTDSVWAISNNDRMPFYHDGPDFDGNKKYKLSMLIRASTAAPFLFKPTPLVIHTDVFGKETTGWFVDGGVTPHNNPSMLMLMMAALPSYHLNWTLSPRDLLMISLGTGMHRSPIDTSTRAFRGFFASLLGRNRCEDINEAAFASQTLQALISNNSMFILKLMQSLSKPRFSWRINSEIGDIHEEMMIRALTGYTKDGKGALKFQRYDLPLEAGRFVGPAYDVDASNPERQALVALDNPKNIPKLLELATQAAKKQVSLADFEGFI
jgi:uncharacterized protein